ncbi:MAG TPA: hypothetical protein VGB86_12005, partial [Methylomirabilota bacterium]
HLTYPTTEDTAAWQPTATSTAVLARLAQVVALDPGTPLFGSLARPGRFMDERELHTWWRRTIVKARVRYRPPETLRHSLISILLSRGAPILAVAAQSGHSPRIMLAHYARWLPPGPEAAPARLAATPAQPAAGAPSAKSAR